MPYGTTLGSGDVVQNLSGHSDGLHRQTSATTQPPMRASKMTSPAGSNMSLNGATVDGALQNHRKRRKCADACKPK